METNDKTLLEIALENTPVSWHEFFKSCKSELDHIENRIKDKRFFPKKCDIFNAFKFTEPSKIKVIIIGQDPYHSEYNGEPISNGLAFSVNYGIPVPPSLQNIYKEIKHEYPEFKIPKHGNLTKWAEQGVFLLNKDLTVEPHKAASHKGLWAFFLYKAIEYIIQLNTQCIFVLWGKNAQELKGQLRKCIVLESGHPSPFSFNYFFKCGHFKKINKLLEKRNADKIIWQL